jgi:xanthine dehydrogenase small subunit
MKRRQQTPSTIIGLRGISALAEINNGDGLTIGAGVTLTNLIADARLRQSYFGLWQAAAQVATPHLRNMGTIGGNIANGSPIGDTPPPFIALGATLTLRKGDERRTMPLEDFFVAYGKQDRQPGEFVEVVDVPVPVEGAHFAVHKITKRRDEDITAVLGAFHLRLAGDGTVSDVRIAYGGMAATPKRAKAVEAMLMGRAWSEATVEEAVEAYAEDFTPLTDMRASAEYRMLVAKNLLRRFYLETTGTAAPVQVSRHEAA